jgi:hypothetical protein
VHEPSPRTLEKYIYASSVFLCVLCLMLIFVFVSRQCERIFMEDGGQADCGVGLGWVGLGVAVVLVAGYSAYRLYGMYRQGPDEG